MVKKVIKETDVSSRIDMMSQRLITEGNQSVASVAKRNKGKNISFGEMAPHTNSVISEKISNQVILESNPNLSRALEILTGFIACPNGGSVVTLHYDASLTYQDEKYNNSASAVCAVLDDYFTNTIKLQNDVNNMIYTALATDGAHITVFLPDSNIENMFDEVGLEDAINNFKLDDPKDTSGKVTKSVTLTMDTNILGLPESKRYLSQLKQSKVGNEGSANKATVNAAKVLRKRRVYKQSPMVSTTRSLGVDEKRGPIVKVISTEATKPMIFKGEPDDPHGYVFVLDEDGYPVEMNEEIDFDKDLRSMSSATAPDEQIKKIANNFSAAKDVNKTNTLDRLQKEFTNHLETEVFNSITEGTYADKYTIEDDELISTIMFHRLLKNQKTRLLFVPAHQVSYFCFDTDKYGVGKSLISKTKALSNIYTVMFYANFIGSLSNAIPHKEVVIDFDQEDIDQNQTLEQVINELILSKVGSFDFNFNGPSDVIRNISKHGIEFKLNNVDSGDLPAMNIEVNDKKRENRPIDNDFLELLSKQLTMKLGFSPELIDKSYSPQFSSQVVQDNDITARQMSKYSSRASEKLTDRVVKQTTNDPLILEKCLDVITGEDKVGMLEDILANLNVTLPTQDSASINEKSEVIEDNIKVIELIVETLFPDSMTDGVDNLSRDHLENARELTKSYFMQDYIRRNSSFKGIVDKVRSKDGIKSILDGEGEFKGVVMEVFADYAEKIIVRDKILDKKLTDAEDKINAKLDAEGQEEETIPDVDNGEPVDDVVDDSTVTPDVETTDDEADDEFTLPTLDA